ncbi:aspartate/glutamate racemase family protein [Bradyrhizobium sp. 25ACV]
MTLQAPRALGVLCLERGLSPGEAPSPIPGSIRNPATFDFPIVSETVSGAWVPNIVRGDPTLEPAYVAAARRLVERGAVAISSTCGFSIRYQAAVAASVNVPVAMSSLLLLPMLLRQLQPPTKIAVLTYDSSCLGDDLLGINDPIERARIVVGGIEGGKFWHDERKRPPAPFDVAAIEADLAACATRLRVAHPEIAAVVFECGAFPFVAPAIRRITGLPIYDITSICRLLLASVG